MQLMRRRGAVRTGARQESRRLRVTTSLAAPPVTPEHEGRKGLELTLVLPTCLTDENTGSRRLCDLAFTTLVLVLASLGQGCGNGHSPDATPKVPLPHRLPSVLNVGSSEANKKLFSSPMWPEGPQEHHLAREGQTSPAVGHCSCGCAGYMRGGLSRPQACRTDDPFPVRSH